MFPFSLFTSSRPQTLDLARVDENINAESDRILHEFQSDDQYSSATCAEKMKMLELMRASLHAGELRARPAPAIPLEKENVRCMLHFDYAIRREIESITFSCK